MGEIKTHKKRKRKLKLKKFLIFLLFVLLFVILVLTVFKWGIKNIYITGNKTYNDYEILQISKLNNHPSFLMTSAFLTELKLEKDPLIKNAIVKKALWWKFNIKIVEYQPYFITDKNILILEKGIEVTDKETITKVDAPLLISNLKESLFNSLVDSFASINPKTITKISEIEYKPSTLDKERFLFLMADGNYAYVTLNNIENINYYSKIVTQLAGKKGIIHFDSYRANDAGITIDILK